jgi:hypothetical protein
MPRLFLTICHAHKIQLSEVHFLPCYELYTIWVRDYESIKAYHHLGVIA